MDAFRGGRAVSSLEYLNDYPPDSYRGLYLLECISFAAIASAIEQLPGKYIVAFVIADFSLLSLDEMTSIVRLLIRSGARYLCAAGPMCQEAHEAFDWACLDIEEKEGSVILTTDHSQESLMEAIWFVLNCAYPCNPYDQDWHATVAICINNQVAAQSVRDAFSDPVRFTELHCSLRDDKQ